MMNMSRMNRLFWELAGCAAIVIGSGTLAPEGRAERPTRPFAPDDFEMLHAMVKPQDGEVLFWKIPWLLRASEARAKAAAAGKPILVWSGYGGAPLAVC